MLLLVYVLKIGFFGFMDPGPHPSTKTELLWSVWSRRARPGLCAEVFQSLMGKTGVESQHEIIKRIPDLKKMSLSFFSFFSGGMNTIESQAINVCWPWSTTPNERLEEGKNGYALNKSINLQLRIFPFAILIKVTQKSIFPSNHTLVIMLIGLI